uniref:Beta-1,4 N-acetylgalactosaminyltransferase n=2 Tax=Sarcophilus harrisii TaxID=9305 RepID=A0A7N4PI84_SARHA
MDCSKKKMLLIVLLLAFFLYLYWDTVDFQTKVIPPLNTQDVDSSTLEILSLKKVKDIFTYEGICFFPQKQCTCEGMEGVKSYNYQNAYSWSDLSEVKARRKVEFKHFQRREGLPRPPPLLAQPNLPFGYPVHGVEVMPFHTVVIPGLQFDGPVASIYKVTIKASLGNLNSLANTPGQEVSGRGEKQLIIETSSRNVLNFILQHVTYTSTMYYSNTMDIVSLELGYSVAKFPVIIRQPIMPKLFDPGPGRKLNALVTITTKTFLRPHKLRKLLWSIRKYYPDLTVIVADDSENPESIDDPYVEHYIMPFAKGWFAGRNLALSQVTTKYVLWVDDDFFFTQNTKIEVLLNVLEKTDLDVVGGHVLGISFLFKLLLAQGEDGSCIHKRVGSFQVLDGFPKCVVTSGIVNFFLAHTEKLRSVGFDPRLKRVAQSEFFIDGLGSLRVGFCSDVVVEHQPKDLEPIPEESSSKKTYNWYRFSSKGEIQLKLALHFFKNYLHCYTEGTEQIRTNKLLGDVTKGTRQ